MIYFLLLVIVAKQSTCASFHGLDSSCSPLDCKVNHWSLWSECSESCLGIPGHQTRFRNQLQAHSCQGLPCPALKETRSCLGNRCMNDGVLNSQGKCVCRESHTGKCCNDRVLGWGSWSSWSPCIKTCGAGCTSKRRTCYKGPEANCTGYGVLMKVCNKEPCPLEKLRFEGLGCFDENEPRAIPILVKNLRPDLDWWHLDKTVITCAKMVKQKGWKVFGIQFYGECWSGPSALDTYAKYGNSSACWDGVGQEGANYVYFIK
ncbi:SCO-spondin-like isoform X1 [Actinia tenebrosa]|uniref:SCO-spondin-like isoform X1 n=1 Tax=Actinia tenebrosa TaxID=6105 RepID=A0A6P8HGV8_ACTTE|nr:SCO-spondin-like isoform X1 [Actinia tenebrosa]